MPGRPRTTLKRVDELIQLAADYGNELYDLLPSQYLERPDSNDATCLAWHRAADAALENCRALYSLRELIAQKAERANRHARLE